MKIFTVYDSKAEAYLTPFFVPTTALAIRSFQSAANTADHDFNRYSADYTLFEIGSYDDHLGVVTPLDAHVNLGTALTYIASDLDLARTERAN